MGVLARVSASRAKLKLGQAVTWVRAAATGAAGLQAAVCGSKPECGAKVCGGESVCWCVRAAL